jgi:4-hydroxybenzoate polyprenyltransferase
MPARSRVDETPHTTAPLTRRRRKYRHICLAFASLALSFMIKPTVALAMGAMGGSKGPVAPVSRKEALSLFGVFFGLFAGLALLHAAEIAITTLYPWKVREFAEEVSLGEKWTAF